MNKKTKEERQRRMLLVLPLLVLPFMAMAFWALGGGQPPEAVREAELLSSLPEPELDGNGPMDKLSLYRKVRQGPGSDGMPGFWEPDTGQRDTGLVTGWEDGEVDTRGEQVMERLEELQKLLDMPATEPAPSLPPAIPSPAGEKGQGSHGNDIDRLESLMEHLARPKDDDPEMLQIENMLDKILDVQHPERVRERQRDHALKGSATAHKVKPVKGGTASPATASGAEPLEAVAFWEPPVRIAAETNGFYGLEDHGPTAPVDNGVEDAVTIPAEVHGEQELVSGATIRLRLAKDVFVDNVRVPKNTLVYGTCEIRGERLEVSIGTILHGDVLLPVKLAVYDMDAIAGIRVPGAITRDSAKEGADDAIQGLRMMSFDPSLQTQMAGAGLEAAKGLFSKKAKLVRVTVKSGHPVLLVDRNFQYR